MEYPFVSIQKGRKKPIVFTTPDGRVHVNVSAPEQFGIATIWDWDLIIYLQAHLNDRVEQGFSIAKRIEFPPYDALRYLGRGTSGQDYRDLVKQLRRLFQTSVVTSIRTDDVSGGEAGFRYITDYRIPKKYSPYEFIQNLEDGEPDSGKPWVVEISEWVLQAVLRRTGVLAVHPDYFGLSGGLERWLYRLARKAVPDNNGGAISFRMETLHKRSASTSPLRNFAGDIRDIAKHQRLPEYGVHVEQDARGELVTLYRDKAKPRRLPRGVQAALTAGKPAKTKRVLRKWSKDDDAAVMRLSKEDAPLDAIAAELDRTKTAVRLRIRNLKLRYILDSAAKKKNVRKKNEI